MIKDLLLVVSLTLFSFFGKSQESTEDLKRLSNIEAIQVGKPLFDIKLPDLKGDSVSLLSHKGKYLYLILWATWCKPCLESMPFYDSLIKESPANEIEFAFISIDADVEKAKQFIKDKNLTGIKLFNGGKKTPPLSYLIYRVIWENENKFKDLDMGLPRYLLIDKNGIILRNDLEKSTKDEVRKLLKTVVSK